MPSREILLIRLNCDFRDTTEIDSNHRGYIGNAELIAGNEAPVAEFDVEPFEAILGVLPLDLRIFGALADTSLEELVALAERISNLDKERQLHAPVPHIDECTFFRTNTKKGWVGFLLFEIAANSDALGDTCTIVEFEHRNSCQRVFLAKLGLPIHRVGDVDIFKGNLDILLGKKYTNPPRIGRDR